MAQNTFKEFFKSFQMGKNISFFSLKYFFLFLHPQTLFLRHVTCHAQFLSFFFSPNLWDVGKIFVSFNLISVITQ